MKIKPSAKDKFNLTAKVRTLVWGHPSLTNKQIEYVLKKSYPRRKFNSRSLRDAACKARRLLEFARGEKGAATHAESTAGGRKLQSYDVAALDLGREFLTAAGGFGAAREYLDFLEHFRIPGLKR